MKVVSGCVVCAIACKQVEAPKATGSGAAPSSGSGSAVMVATDAAVAVDAAAPLAAFCIGEHDVDGSFVAADDKAVTFCFHLDENELEHLPERDKCAVLDLATGTFISAAITLPNPTTGDFGPRRPLPPIVELAKLGLPADAELEIATSPDGNTHAAVSSEAPGKLFIVDAKARKLRKTVTWNADGGCMEAPSFVGENIYVQYNVCAGPGATGWFVSPAGKKLGRIEHVNPTGAFFDLGNDRYAFEDFGGTGVEIVDGKRGKSLGEVAVEPPQDCDDRCPTFGPHSLSLVKLPGGKLVQFSSVVALVDPAAPKPKQLEKRIMWPICPKQP